VLTYLHSPIHHRDTALNYAQRIYVYVTSTAKEVDLKRTRNFRYQILLTEDSLGLHNSRLWHKGYMALFLNFLCFRYCVYCLRNI